MRKIIKLIFILLLMMLIALVVSNVVVVAISSRHIKEDNELIASRSAGETLEYECIIVLGASVQNGEPSPILKKRVDKGIELYNAGLSKKLLFSGDNGSNDYNEVGAMRDYAIRCGVPAEDIVLDYAGFSTYDSMYRLKHVFGVNRAIVVTQKYHLYRAVFIGNSIDIDVCGVSAERQDEGQLYRDVREAVARPKDIASVLFKVKPKFYKEKSSL